MKVALLADLHLGSKAISDGKWKFQALERTIAPKLRDLKVTHLIFPGDTLDFAPGASKRNTERPQQLQLAVDILQNLGLPSYLLLGNHDDEESCGFFERMGGPKVVRDDWIEL